MKINVILASTREGGIGFKNNIPWFIKDDLQHFKRVTKEDNYVNIVLMGRKTWESLPKKPLPDRIHLVLTKNTIEPHERTYVYSEMSDALNHCFELTPQCNVNLSIIGGSSIYRAFYNLYLEHRDKYKHYLYHSIIHRRYECDRFFSPNYDYYDELTQETKNVMDYTTNEKVLITYSLYKSK